MDNSIKIFKNDVFGEVRVAGTSEEPLFCLADVCNAVELSNPSFIASLTKVRSILMCFPTVFTFNPLLRRNASNSFRNV